MVTETLAYEVIRVYRFEKAGYPRILVAGLFPGSKAGPGWGLDLPRPRTGPCGEWLDIAGSRILTDLQRSPLQKETQ
jgi:hypothetical protein